MAFAELTGAPAGRLPVKVIRSTRRKKSSAARVVAGVIEVRIPSWMSRDQERTAVDSLVARIEKKRSIDDSPIDLMRRARALAKTYRLPLPIEIRWATNQNTLWGSCTFEDGVIRLSSRLLPVPDWVLDYVIVHELTHLVESDHNARFHALMQRYPKAERAEGFLEAMSVGFGPGGPKP